MTEGADRDEPELASAFLERLRRRGAASDRYERKDEVGRGGQGTVLRVWDVDLHRELAMKVLLGDAEAEGDGTPITDTRSFGRFLDEAQVTGQLDHPGIVPVHELGVDHEGRLFFTMKLVKGRTLQEVFALAAEGKEDWTRTRVLGVLLKVCEAMAYAHHKGVVHRDLKPGNVMVGRFGEVFVMDWGLARVLSRVETRDARLGARPASLDVVTDRRRLSAGAIDSPLVTLDGEVVGTPVYMAPEQARGQLDLIGPQTDVYAVGAMLYHLLAGHMPYVTPGEAVDTYAVWYRVQNGPPEPLERRAREASPELIAICEKAMAREIEQRYADMGGLAADLRAFLENRVVSAHRVGPVVELRKWTERNRGLAAALVAGVLVLLAGLGVSLWQKSVADRNADLATEREREATLQSDRARTSQELAETRAREADEAALRASTVSGFLTRMLSSANPRNSLRHDLLVSDLVDEAAQRLDAGEIGGDPWTEYVMRTTLADSYQGIGLYEESERQYRLAAEILAVHPVDDPTVAITLDLNLADTLEVRGRLTESEALSRKALAAIHEARIEKSLLHARALQMLARTRYTLGSTDEAVELQRSALAIGVELDDSDASMARLHRGLAFYLKEKGLVQEALDEVQQAMEVLDSRQDMPQDLSAALRTRADLYQKEHRWNAAQADLERALQVIEQVFGEESSEAADIRIDLAVFAQSQGQLEAAETHARRALETRRRLLGEHRDTATALAVMGSILAQGGERDEAEELLQESLEMRRKVLPPDSAAIGDSLRRLGSVARDRGDRAEAERDFREALDNWGRNLPADHPDLASLRFDLGNLLGGEGRSDEARECLEACLRTREALFGPTAGPTNEARDALINLLLGDHDWTEAEERIRAILPEYERTLRSGHPVIAYTGAQLGVALVGQGRYEEAEPLLLAGWKAIGEDSRYWAVNKLLILDGLIALATALEDEEGAREWSAKAAALRK